MEGQLERIELPLEWKFLAAAQSAWRIATLSHGCARAMQISSRSPAKGSCAKTKPAAVVSAIQFHGAGIAGFPDTSGAC